jgi:hypothetical protein
MMDDYEMMDWLIASGGFASAYIAQWDEPQLLDQTDMKQWSKCVIEVGWRPPREGGPTWQGSQAGRPDMSDQPIPPSGEFYILLVPLSDPFT